jgi:hypothetical protein
MQGNYYCLAILGEPSKGKGLHRPINNLAREIPEIGLEVLRFPFLRRHTTGKNTVEFRDNNPSDCIENP